MIGPVIFFLFLWIVAGLATFWWGTRTPQPGTRRLVRTCGRRIAFVGSELPVDLWPSAQGLPERRGELRSHRVVLVLDHSDSMGSGPGSGLEAARSAALSFVHGSFSDHCLIGIVAFDDGASVLAPVGAGLEAVTGGLARIRPGGGTNIAAGLEAAGRALGEGSAADAREVVLLLSDGGSGEAPALAEARCLKERGARVMTIGLGRGVNRRLLAALASSEEDFSHTLDPQHLARLYEAAASALEGDRGFRAQIEESVAAAHFAIAGYGEVQPYTVDGGRGILRWFLPFVSERPGRRASYRLIARRWGWYRVASRPARIEMFGHDGQPHEGTSNPSPHVLVLPRLAWPFWLLFLNPLFWMIASRLGLGRGDGLEVRQPPTPRPVPLPDVWQPRLPGSSSAAQALTPALLLGVGQTGGLVLRALSFHLASLPPGAAQNLRLLWVDTGPEPVGAGDDEVELGPPISPRDRVLLPENLEPLFRRRKQTLAPEPHLAWLDAEREMETLRPQDFDLSRGTHGRRVLGRAALYHHLEGPRPALTEALDERLRSLPSGYRVIVMGNLAGGTGGGTLLDLLVYLKKRMRGTGNPARSIDLLLLTHRAGGDRGGLEPIELESSQAFAVELGRMLFQGDLPHSYPQEPGETPADREVRRFLDRVLVMEQTLDDTQSAPCWPGPAAHAAAQVLFQILAAPGAGADAFLEESRRRLRQSERSSGQPMVFAVGSAWRSLPVPQARELLMARAVRDYVARDLLGLEASGDRLVVAKREEVEKAGRSLASDLLAGQGLTRALPELLDALEPLSEAESVGPELGRRLQELDFLPGSSVRIDFAGDALLAQALDAQQGIFDALLQEWVLEHLNGRPREDGTLDPAIRRGALPRLVAAVRRLATMSEAATANLRGVEASVRKQGLGARIDFLTFLIGRYHQSIKTMDRHLAAWWQALTPDPEAPWNHGASLTAVVARAAADASRKLSRLADRLCPSVCWSPEIEQRFVERYAEPIRDRLGERVLWLFEPVAGDPAPCPSLCVGDPQKSWGPAGIEDLRKDLERASLALGLAQIEDERLDDAVDLSSWLAPGSRRDPVRFEANRQAEAAVAAQRREFLLVPPGTAIPGRQAEDLMVGEGGGRHGSSIVRVLSPCALAAVGGLSDAERHTAGSSHAALPWLDPVDRRAAEQEDFFPRIGLQAPFLGPLLRVYFQEPDRLRAFVLASSLAMIEKSIAGDAPVLSLCGHRLTGESRDAEEPLLLEALDLFCREGRTAPPEARPIDLQQVAAVVERRLAATDDGELVKRSREAAEILAPVLDGCPGRTAEDFIGLARLACELELERRRRRQGGAA